MKRLVTCILLAFAVVPAGCASRDDSRVGDRSVRSDRATLSWDSPRLVGLEKEWNQLYESSRDDALGKEKDWWKILNGLLAKHLSNADLHDLAQSCGTLPIREEDRAVFVNIVLHYMVTAFVDSGDREGLVTLLSTRFRDRIYSEWIEEYLMRDGEGRNTLKYPILILGDAYSRCGDPEVRREIARAIRRGFSTMDVPALADSELSDDEYVNKAMEWYGKHKDELAFNPMYYPIPGATGYRDLFFRPKADADRDRQREIERVRPEQIFRVTLCIFVSLLLLVALALCAHGLAKCHKREMVAGYWVFAAMCASTIVLLSDRIAVVPFLAVALIALGVDTLAAGAFGGETCPLKRTPRLMLSLGLGLSGTIALLLAWFYK